MQKLSVVCFSLLVVVLLLLDHACAVTYTTDVLEQGNPGGWTASLKTFDEEVIANQGQSLTIDIWATDAPGQATAGGLWIDYTGSTNIISYVSAQRYNKEIGSLPGPWQPGAGVIIDEPDGPGTLMVIVGNLGGATPDGDGDIIIARVVMEVLSSDDAEIVVSTVPSVMTWGPADNGWNDASIEPATLTLSSESTTTSVSDSTTTSVQGSTTTSVQGATTTTSMQATSSTTSSSISPRPCLVEQIYGEDSVEVALCRYIRDSVLRNTTEGREIIKIYYDWSPHLVRALKEETGLKDQVKKVIDHILLLTNDEKD